MVGVHVDAKHRDECGLVAQFETFYFHGVASWSDFENGMTLLGGTGALATNSPIYAGRSFFQRRTINGPPPMNCCMTWIRHSCITLECSGCRTIVMKKIHADPFDPLRGIGPGSDGPLARTGPHGSVRPIEHHLTAVVADPDPVWIESSPFKIPWVVLDQISMESAKVFIAGTRSVLWPMRGQQDVPFRFVVQVIAGHFISSVSMP